MSIEHTSEASYRSPLSVAIAVVLAMSISLLPLVPGVEHVLGVGWQDVAVAMAAISLLMVVGAALYRVAPTSALYRRFDRIETVGIELALAFMIFRSGRADSFFWIAILAHSLITAHSTLNARFNRAVFAGIPLLLAVLFLVVHRDLSAFATTIVIGSLGLYLFQQVYTVSRRLEIADRERARLAAELADTRLHEDRERIARDIHDGIGADLAALDWRLREIRARSGAELASEIDAISGRLARGTEDLRSIVWALRTPDRSWNDLVAYVRQCGAELCGHQIAFALTATESADSYPGELALDFLRAVLELVRNAVRHAKPSRVSVELTSTPEALVACVTDDGHGLAPEIRSEGGLANLRRRVARTGGSLSIAGQRVEVRMAA